MTITVDSDRLGNSYLVNSNVCKKFDCLACLSCVNSSSESCIALLANLGNRLCSKHNLAVNNLSLELVVVDNRKSTCMT